MVYQDNSLCWSCPVVGIELFEYICDIPIEGIRRGFIARGKVGEKKKVIAIIAVYFIVSPRKIARLGRIQAFLTLLDIFRHIHHLEACTKIQSNRNHHGYVDYCFFLELQSRKSFGLISPTLHRQRVSYSQTVGPPQFRGRGHTHKTNSRCHVSPIDFPSYPQTRTARDLRCCCSFCQVSVGELSEAVSTWLLDRDMSELLDTEERSPKHHQVCTVKMWSASTEDEGLARSGIGIPLIVCKVDSPSPLRHSLCPRGLGTYSFAAVISGYEHCPRIEKTMLGANLGIGELQSFQRSSHLIVFSSVFEVGCGISERD